MAELNLIVLQFRRVYFLSEDRLVQDIFRGENAFVRTPCGTPFLHMKYLGFFKKRLLGLKCFTMLKYIFENVFVQINKWIEIILNILWLCFFNFFDETLCFAHPPSTEFYTLVCNLTHTDCATGMIEIMCLLFFSDKMYNFHLVGSKTLHSVHKHGSV